MEPLLRVERLTMKFGGVVALDDATLTIHQGEIVGLIGPNGAGKTTLFNCVTGILRPDHGTVQFGGAPRASPSHHQTPNPVGRHPAHPLAEAHARGPRPEAVARWRGREQLDSLTGLAPHHIVQCGIARTFQNIRLFTHMSVLDNVLVGTFIRTHAGLISATLLTREARREERWARDRAMGLLEFTGLGERSQEMAGSLPFGLQRRLELARALASDPTLLLLDEPAAGLNPVEKQQLLRFIAQLKSQGLTVMLIEHDMQVVMPISDRVIVLDYGRKIADGSPSTVQADPKVIEAYLGAVQRRNHASDS